MGKKGSLVTYIKDGVAVTMATRAPTRASESNVLYERLNDSIQTHSTHIEKAASMADVAGEKLSKK
ncbi:hypothetical protein E2C01_088413 [Portunus trituberculatus]|uniref:Uncharacterized protein n=1 Tax=Portunus trituberculatus TaxID=210409 RepID=A0A5B7JEE9_PORTR|nr:hypothetical protein [Portunus trituberculatus]